MSLQRISTSHHLGPCLKLEMIGPLMSETCLSVRPSAHPSVLPQSDREKAEGLPVAPFMDREKVTKPTAQIGFIKFVLIPMFETVMKVSVQQGAPLCSAACRLHTIRSFCCNTMRLKL